MTGVVDVGSSIKEFIRLPHLLYSKELNYVPQLDHDMRVHFSAKNPFFESSKAKFFIFRRNGEYAGRIAAFINEGHNAYHDENMGFFGFFDCINDQAAADELFNAAAEYLRREGASAMRGPMNFSTNEECGFLLEGFDEPPIIMMPYNFPYYDSLALTHGLSKIKDLYAYIYEVQEELPEKVHRVSELVSKRGISVRPINMKKFEADMMIFKEIYHSAWGENWGFVPMSDKELLYAAGRLKQIIIPEMTLIAEKDGEPVGFMGLVPDFNQVLGHMKGRLNPVTIAKALYYSRKITDLRVMLLGIKKEFRNKGVEALLFRHGFPPIKKGHYKRVEFSWILEDNLPVQRTIELFGGKIYKKYRIYEKSL